MPANQALPVGLSCDNLSLLRDLTLCSDNLLFTWNSWLKRGGRHDGLVNLGALLRPTLSAADLRIDCAIVQLADRTLSPPDATPGRSDPAPCPGGDGIADARPDRRA